MYVYTWEVMWGLGVTGRGELPVSVWEEGCVGSRKEKKRVYTCVATSQTRKGARPPCPGHSSTSSHRMNRKWKEKGNGP